MTLTINRTRLGAVVFHDSLNHVKGSLAQLAKDTCPQDIRKGDFPHLFNTAENWDNDYSGSIPNISYFDVPFKAYKPKDLKAFKTFYFEHLLGYAESKKRINHRYVDFPFKPLFRSSGQQFTWNFRKELLAYARNDVSILATVLKAYNDAAFNMHGIYPLFHPTAPGYIHHVVKTENSKLLDIGSIPDAELESTLTEMARTQVWAVLKDGEYWRPRRTLRGGRTNIYSVYYKLSPEELARGDIIRYVDVVSMYPAMQVAKEFPVGLPEIIVYNPEHIPCIIHKANRDTHCTCPPRIRKYPNLNVTLKTLPTDQPTDEEFLAYLKTPGYGGFICADLIPPKDLWHPIICFHDPRSKKTLFSNEDLKNCYTTSIELQTALENGYKIRRLHIYDRYHFKPSLWRDVTRKLIVQKTINSKPTPQGVAAEKLIEEYAQIGDDFAQAIKETIQKDQWASRPALKQTAKTHVNVVWGKNAQQAIMPQTKYFRTSDDKAISEFFEDCSKRQKTFISGTPLGEMTKFRFEHNGHESPTDFSQGYLPAAVFVTAYARLTLWEEMNKIDSNPNDRRVLMCDTDSVIYVQRADPTAYRVPTGKALGKWEIEDDDIDHGGIVEFTALGPKSYAFKCNDGFTKIKVKGVSLKAGHRNMVNFETMKRMVLEQQLNNTSTIIPVPQWGFVYKQGDGMRKHMSFKNLMFNHEEMKGTLEKEGRVGVPPNFIAPFGFSVTQ